MEHTSDFMMAVVVGSTAFIALTPVLVGQVTGSGLERNRKKAVIGLIAISVFFGIVSILSAIFWFLGSESSRVDETMFIRLVLQMFVSEIVWYEIVMFGFWFGLFGEIEPSKPVTKATRVKRSRK